MVEIVQVGVDYIELFVVFYVYQQIIVGDVGVIDYDQWLVEMLLDVFQGCGYGFVVGNVQDQVCIFDVIGFEGFGDFFGVGCVGCGVDDYGIQVFQFQCNCLVDVMVGVGY